MSYSGPACSGDPDVEEDNLDPANTAVKDEGSSIPSTIFNLTNTIIGAGEYLTSVPSQYAFDDMLLVGLADPLHHSCICLLLQASWLSPRQWLPLALCLAAC